MKNALILLPGTTVAVKYDRILGFIVKDISTNLKDTRIIVEYYLDLKDSEIVAGRNELWDEESTVDVALKVKELISLQVREND